MEETFARALQFTLAGAAAFAVALWFAMSIWTYRDIERRSSNIVVQVLATLVVVLGFIPGIVIYLLLRPRETVEQRYQREIEESYLAQELSAVPACPRCDRAVRDEFIFCPDCGTSLRRTCGSCGRLVDADWNICAFCGHDLPARGAASANGRGRVATTSRRQRQYANTDDWEVDIDSDSDEERPSRQRSGQPSPAAGGTQDSWR